MAKVIASTGAGVMGWKRGVFPKRAGVYRIRFRLFLGHFRPQWITAYAYWSRRRGWRNDGQTPKEALKHAHYPLDMTKPRWRPLTASEIRRLGDNALAASR